MLDRNTWNHLTVCKRITSGSFKSATYKLFTWKSCIYIYLPSSSSCRAISTDIPDHFSPPSFIALCFRQVVRATPRIGTKLLYVGSSWSSCLCSSMWRGPQEYITYEFVHTSPAVFRMSGSSNFDSFHDGWWVSVQLLPLWGAASRTCSISLAAPTRFDKLNQTKLSI